MQYIETIPNKGFVFSGSTNVKVTIEYENIEEDEIDEFALMMQMKTLDMIDE